MTGSDPGRRQKRVAGRIQDEMSRVFIQDIQRLFKCLITVTRVEMPPDLKSATVYLTIMGSDDLTTSWNRSGSGPAISEKSLPRPSI
ncbi:MAG: ribosome-binding factor A [Candidatus Aminicenantes bacterium]|nr:ribosome-binding factor A [Candidatus Aminicenantes bacterium]